MAQPPSSDAHRDLRRSSVQSDPAISREPDPPSDFVVPAAGLSRVTHRAYDATEALHVVADEDFPFAVGSMSIERHGQYQLAMIIKAVADLRVGGPADLRSRGVTLSGDVAWRSGGALRFPSDWVASKENADVVLVGHAYAPEGGATAAVVRFQLGHSGNRFDRTMAVFGDRHWQKKLLGRSAGDAVRFDRMPLGYSRAFGGAGYAANPIGIGFDAGGKPERLPNLEDPRALITVPDAQPQPMSFAPVPLDWQHPDAFADATAVRQGPLLPAGLATQAVQYAPASQMLKFLRGDEPYRCEGMTDDHQPIAGTLPEARPRAFVGWRHSRGFEELRLRLDTVCFDVDERELRLVWRGAIPVLDARASDVATVYFTNEVVGAPRMGVQEARQKFLA